MIYSWQCHPLFKKHSLAPPVSCSHGLKPLKLKMHKTCALSSGIPGYQWKAGCQGEKCFYSIFLNSPLNVVFTWLLKRSWNWSLGRPRWTGRDGGQWAARNPRKTRPSREGGERCMATFSAGTVASFPVQQSRLSLPVSVVLWNQPLRREMSEEVKLLCFIRNVCSH